MNIDFADVKAVMKDSGTGDARRRCRPRWKNRAEEAAMAAISAPLIEQSIDRATGIVFNITGGNDLTLQEISQVSGGEVTPGGPQRRGHLRQRRGREVQRGDSGDHHRHRVRVRDPALASSERRLGRRPRPLRSGGGGGGMPCPRGGSFLGR